MSVYAIALLSIDDREEYGRYEQGFMEIFQKYRGKLLSVDEQPTIIEGEWPYTRTVLLEFPDRDELDRWYRSDEYQALVQHRFRASRASVAVIESFDAATAG